MKASHRFLISILVLMLPGAAEMRQQTGKASTESRADNEAFLSNGRIVTDAPADGETILAGES